MGQKTPRYRCVRKLRYPSALRNANKARKKLAEDLARVQAQGGEQGEEQAQQTPEKEPPQKLDPMETIFLFQSQNEDVLKTNVEIKKEPSVYEIGPSKPLLELDVEYEPNTRTHLQNLVLPPKEPKAKSVHKKSARLKANEVRNQEKILKAIQKQKKKETNEDQSEKDSDAESEDSDSDDSDEEDCEHEMQDQEIETSNAVYYLQNELDIKQEITQEVDCLKNPIELEHINGNQHDENTHTGTDRTVNEDQNLYGVMTENEGQNIQTEALLVERANVSDVQVKRKRGRPRKSMENKPVVVTQKRKRGRPPKPKDITNKDYTDTSVKRKRGRPRKTNVTAANEDMPVAAASTQQIEDDSEEEYTVFISEDVIEEPIHLEVQGVINFLV